MLSAILIQGKKIISLYNLLDLKLSDNIFSFNPETSPAEVSSESKDSDHTITPDGNQNNEL